MDGLERIAEMYRNGTSINVMVFHFQHSPHWIYDRLRSMGIHPGRRPKGRRYYCVEDDPLTAEVRRLRSDGLSIEQICRVMKKCEQYVRRRVRGPIEQLPPDPRKLNAKPRTSEISRPQVALLCAMYHEGDRVGEIARKLNLTEHAIRSCLWHEKCYRFQKKPRKSGWPRIYTNMRRALRGRVYEDIEFVKTSNNIGAMRKNARLHEQPAA